MEVISRLDAGPIISQEEVEITEEDDARSLHDKLSKLGAELLVKTLPGYLSGKITPIPQREEEATYCAQIKKEMGRIDWRESAQKIFNKIRAFTPWPSAYAYFNGKLVKITKARPVEGRGEPGEVIRAGKELVVATGEGALKVERIKPEGRKEITGEEFVRGYRVKAGDRFG